MSAVTNLSFGSLLVRVVDRDGEPWFVATDVCFAMELTNPSSAIKILDDDERAKVDLGSGSDVNIISESGLYTLMFRSQKAIDQESNIYRFRKWVTSEVLPAIRRQGRYDAIEQAPERRIDPDERDMAMKLALVREARQTFGRRAAQEIWSEIGLPMVPQSEPVGGPVRPIHPQIAEWVREQTQGGGGFIRSSELYDDFLRWCGRKEIEPVGQTAFGRDLTRMGYVSKKSGPIWRWGLRLKEQTASGIALQ